MAKTGMNPRMVRRQGPFPPKTRGGVGTDSMNQGSFQHDGKIDTNSVGSALGQKSKTPPGKIAPGKVPRVRNSMHQ